MASSESLLEDSVAKWKEEYDELYSLFTHLEHIKSKKLTDSFTNFEPLYKEIKEKINTIKQSIDKYEDIISITNKIYSKSMSNMNYFQLLLNVKQFKINIANDHDNIKCLFFLWNNTKNNFLSQQYCLKLSNDDLQDIDQSHNKDIKILFTNLTKEIFVDDIFIISHIYRIGTMEYHQQKNNKQKQKKKKKQRIFLRPFAISIFKLNNYKKELLQNINKEIHIQCDETPIYIFTEEFLFANISHIIKNTKKLLKPIIGYQYYNRERMSIDPESIGFHHSYTLFHGDINYVEKHYKHFDKLQIMESLNHRQNALNIYVIIFEAHVNQRNKAAQCNVETRMCIKHNETKEIATKCIEYGKSSMIEMEEDEIKTAIYYHTNDPIYNQLFTIKVSNILGGFSDYHLFFNCWHCSVSTHRVSDERGFGFIKLDALINKSGYNEYDILLYRLPRNSVDIDYMSPDSLHVLKPEGHNVKYKKCVKIGVYATNIKQYFKTIVCGYIKTVENALFCTMPNDLRMLIFQYLY